MVRPPRLTGSITGPRSQNGVAAIYAAASLVAGVSAMAMAIDVGQLYYAQRDLQKLADAAALDASRAASGCFVKGGGAPPSSPDTVRNAVTASIQSNLDRSVVKDLTLAADYMRPIDGGSVPTVEIGKLDNKTVAGVRNFASNDSAAGLDNGSTDSVRVNLARIQPTPLIPFIFSTSTDSSAPGLLRASASAQQTPTASYSIGSTLATAGANPSLLNPLLGGTGSATLTLASFQGLASAAVNLGDVAVQLGLAQAGPGGAPGMITTGALQTPISQSDFLAAVANALSSEGQGAAASTLSALAAASTGQGLPSTLGDIVGAGASALPVNLFDLLTAASGSFNTGLYPLKLAPVVNVPGLANASIFVTVGEPAQPGIGHAGFKADGVTPRTSANTAQVKLMIRQNVAVPGLGNLRLGTDVTVASARSFISGIQCPSGINSTPQPIVFLDVTTAPATVSVGTFDPANPTNPVAAGPLLTATIPLVGSVTINTGGIIPAHQVLNTSQQVAKFEGPYSKTMMVGGDVSGLDIGAAVVDSVSKLSLQACLSTVLGTSCQNVLAGGPAGGVVGTLGTLVVQPVLAQLAPAVTALDTAVDSTLLALGAQVGPASVTVASLVYREPTTAATADTNSVPRLFNLEPTFQTVNANAR